MADPTLRHSPNPFARAACMHRINSEGLHESICLICFSIIASGTAEADLAIAEELHRCELIHLTIVPALHHLVANPEPNAELYPEPDPELDPEPDPKPDPDEPES